MFKRINIYVFKEIAAPFFLSLGILTLTALLSKVIKLIELMVTQGISLTFVFWFVMSVIPSFVIYTVPIAFLIGVLMAFTRLSSDSEITAMKASGLSLFTLIRPVVVVAMFAFALSLVFTLYMLPWGNANLKALLFDVSRTKLLSGLEEKTFYDRFKDAVLYVDRISPKTGEMEGVFITQSGVGKGTSVFFAKKGAFVSSGEKATVRILLYDGALHTQSKEGNDYHIADFSSYSLELNLVGGEPTPAWEKPNRERYISELMEKIRTSRARGENVSRVVIDLHKRFTIPASVFVFSLLGVPLGIQRIRAARFAGFSVAMAVVLIYYVLSTAFEALGENRHINPVVAVWGSNIVFTFAGAYFFYREAKDAPVNVVGWVSSVNPFKRRTQPGAGKTGL